MCIAYLALHAHPEWPLFIAANRDEYHARPAQPAAPWASHPAVIAGIDQQAGGTWLGVTQSGRFGLLTNFREAGKPPQAGLASRGDLVRRFLAGDDPPADFSAALQARRQDYAGFNLIVGDVRQAFYAGNRTATAAATALGPGRYVLSNHLLDTPWPKSERLRQGLLAWPGPALSASLDPIFALLQDTKQAEDAALPSTGLPLARERLLSSPFIRDPDYGTRCSTIIAIHASGHGFLSELSFDPAGCPTQRHDWPFRIHCKLHPTPQAVGLPPHQTPAP